MTSKNGAHFVHFALPALAPAAQNGQSRVRVRNHPSLRALVSALRCASNTRKVAVGTVRKSIETSSQKWLSRNVRQVCDGGFLFFVISRETVLSEISIPSLSDSSWMRGATHSRTEVVHYVGIIRILYN